MTKMARITDGVVDDIIVPIDGFTIEECFHPDMLSHYVVIADEVQSGWVVTEDGIVDPNAPELEAVVEEATAEETPTEEAPPA